MPRKRTPHALRETPEARALRAAIVEELEAPLLAESDKAVAKAARSARRFVARVAARGGDVAALHAEIDRDAAKRPAVAVGDLYAAHRGSVRPTPRAVIEPPAPSAVEEKPSPKKRAKRLRAGLVGYARITDADDWED